MDTFSPELVEHWRASQPSSTDEPVGSASAESVSAAQQEALEELAERVSAARSVY